MIKSIVITLLFAGLFSASSNAQGYRGKRFSVAYQPSYALAGFYTFNRMIMYNRVNLGFALGDHLTVNLSGQYGKTKEKEWSGGGYENFGINDITGGISLLYFRKFHQNYAPIGRYMGIGFEYGQQNAGRTILEPVEGSSYSNELDYYDSEERTSLMVISAYFGRNFLAKEKFLLGWGIQYGWCMGDKANQTPSMRMLVKPNFTFGIIF